MDISDGKKFKQYQQLVPPVHVGWNVVEKTQTRIGRFSCSAVFTMQTIVGFFAKRAFPSVPIAEGKNNKSEMCFYYCKQVPFTIR